MNKMSRKGRELFYAVIAISTMSFISFLVSLGVDGDIFISFANASLLVSTTMLLTCWYLLSDDEWVG